MPSVPLPTDPEPEQEPERADPADPSRMKAPAALLLALLLCGQPGTRAKGHPCSERGQHGLGLWGPSGHPAWGQDMAWGAGGSGWSLRLEGRGRGLSWAPAGSQTYPSPAPDPTSLKCRLRVTSSVPASVSSSVKQAGHPEGLLGRWWGEAAAAKGRPPQQVMVLGSKQGQQLGALWGTEWGGRGWRSVEGQVEGVGHSTGPGACVLCARELGGYRHPCVARYQAGAGRGGGGRCGLWA